MLCTSRLAIIYILLAAASSTPFAPRDNDDGALANLAGDQMAPAAPRQVYTGHHGPAEERAHVTKAVVLPPAPVVRNIHAPDNEGHGAAHQYPGHAGMARDSSDSSSDSATGFCTMPAQTVSVSVQKIVTIFMNVATLWPKPIIRPRDMYADDADAEAEADNAPPIPTADLLLNNNKNNNLGAQEGVDWRMPAAEGLAERDEVQGGEYQLPVNLGGVMAKATPPLVPALATIAPAQPANSSSSTTTEPTSSGGVVASTPAPTQAATPAVPLAVDGCTTTMLAVLGRPCRAAGALTVYPSTVTSYAPVDCGACANLHVLQPKWGCPFMSISAEVTADQPYTWTTYVCAGATTPSSSSAAAVAAAETTPPLASQAVPALESLLIPALESLLPALQSMGTSAFESVATSAVESLVTPVLESLAGIATAEPPSSVVATFTV